MTELKEGLEKVAPPVKLEIDPKAAQALVNLLAHVGGTGRTALAPVRDQIEGAGLKWSGLNRDGFNGATSITFDLAP